MFLTDVLWRWLVRRLQRATPKWLNTGGGLGVWL
jgi:hypothetical protein